MINKKWALGVQDRGHEHYSYAVMTESGELLLECGLDKELAEHIIDIHNKEYDREARVIKGIQFCEKHGGYGFQSDCLECNK